MGRSQRKLLRQSSCSGRSIHGHRLSDAMPPVSLIPLVPRNVTINNSRKRCENQRDYDESTTHDQPLAHLSSSHTKKKKDQGAVKKASHEVSISGHQLQQRGSFYYY